MHVITQKDVENVIQKRIETGHKGTFGRVSVIGGNANMGGAAIMAVQAAVKAGAGLTTCISHKANLTALHARVPEAMFIDYFDNDALCKSVSQSNVVVVGPGLGTDETAKQVFSSVLKNANQTLIIDGSAITMLAEDNRLKKLTPSAKIIFTPHELEWQRLSGLSQAEQSPAKNAAKALELNADVVLKKHGTEIYHLSGKCSKLMIGGPYMSTGGMGDTLTGICAAFLAQFKGDQDQILDAAVYTHSDIANLLAKERYVVLPSEIADNLQKYMKHRCNGQIL